MRKVIFHLIMIRPLAFAIYRGITKLLSLDSVLPIILVTGTKQTGVMPMDWLNSVSSKRIRIPVWC